MNTFKTNSQQGHQKHNRLTALTLAILATSCNGFTAPATQANSIQATRHATAAAAAMSMTPQAQDSEGSTTDQQSRRSVLSSLLTTTVAATMGASVLFPSEAFAEAESMERGGVPLTPFNSLAFNYRGGESPTVDPSAINEVSIPYSEFLEKLASDQVTFVEFLAPNGDKAYATLKSTTGEAADSSSSGGETIKPIRIGEGYPIEDPEGWSSPAFVIKAVAKKGVPYKFVVPGLSDSFKM
mmetsp:Transcript_19549/g.35389  ORF Transcript_19549/g.35389 Transcript_19549/m.35389 type:complete len:240 (-) Transcript_19549:116-835(-)